MKSFSSFGLVLATAAASVLLSPAWAGGSLQGEPVFTVDNHQRKVTIKAEDGSFLFSQIIDSDTVKLAVVAQGKQSARMSLQDASGKTLWSKVFSRAADQIQVSGVWLKTSQASMNRVLDGLKPKEQDFMDRSLAAYEEVIVGPDDQMVSARFEVSDGKRKHVFTVANLRSGYAAQLDGRSLPIVRVTGH